ncbi:unnamed protein product [Moneuplotes crassus]|uniref:Uncharacterized protein n=1 Tax=Euplotes crassus TaxID=5936 RepID=A0AAD1XDS8_EUPCR|nr:unnamed protein product [Moneuplotes crassus]
MAGASSLGKGQRTDFTKENRHSPGPGAYNSSKMDASKEKKPTYSIPKSPRKHYSTMGEKIPGPGSYDIPTKIGGANVSFGLKHSHTISSSTPGPGNYSPMKSPKNSFGYSFGMRTQKVNSLKKNIPGPGSYNFDDSFNKKIHLSGTFSKDKKLADYSRSAMKNNPGPGNYSPDSEIFDSVRRKSEIKFSSSERDFVKRVKNVLPGPGSYTIPGEIGRESPKFSLSPKRKEIDRSTKLRDSPGPSDYHPEYSFTKKDSPKNGFGSQKRFVPSPKKRKNLSKIILRNINNKLSESIDPDKASKKKSPSFSFGTSNRSSIVKRMHPGPGDYAIPSQIASGKRFSMGGRTKLNSTLFETPGPGQYNPSDRITIRNDPKFGIGSSQRPSASTTKNLPGPGAYNTESNGRTRLFKNGKFGSEERIKIRTKIGPGPGSYKIPTKIVEAPSYLVTKDEKYAFV